MNPRTASLLILLALVAFAASAEEASDLPFHLPTPEGWRTETIPFPLGFAPELDYEGLEELRFSPGMFQNGADDFWTYAFVWWIAADTALDTARLSTDLAAYFRGLSGAVAEQNGFDPGDAAFRAKFEESTGAKAGRRVFRGQAETLDAFVTRESVTLHVRVETIPCSDQERLAVIFELSPQEPEHAVWKSLTAIREGFRCVAN